MPDIADDHAAFREAMARAEAASGIERDAEGNETNGIEAIVSGQTPAPTSEPVVAVPVVASDQPLPPDPVTPVADTPEPEAVAPAEPLSVEELQQQLAVATARLEEKDSFIGKQSTDVGELRQTVAELSARLDAQQQTPTVQPSVAATTVVTQELVNTDPALAAEAAYVQGDENSLKFVMEQWKDMDPFMAASWRDDKLREQQQKAFDAKIAEQEAKIAAVAAPVAESAATRAESLKWEAALDTVKGKFPEVFVADESGNTTVQRLLLEAGTKPEYEAFKVMLQTGDADAKAAAISALYALDKVGNPDAFKAQLEADAQEAAAAAAAARAGASAVNGQTTAGQGGELKTEAELEAEATISRMASKPSLSKGWTGRG
jgi:hypothetical protein